MKKFGILVCFILMNSILFSQMNPKGGDADVSTKLSEAGHAYNAGNMDEALKLYTEANEMKPDDGSILFHIGQCYYSLQQLDEAMEYLQKAEAADSNANEDLNLGLGMVYQQENQLDKAIAEFHCHERKYKDDPKMLLQDYVNHLTAECVLAKEMEKHPVNVKIRNAGENINSGYDDKSPSVTANGTVLIFTSTRPFSEMSGTESLDGGGGMQGFDNVYICKWDSAKSDWGPSEPIDGDVNEPQAHTSCSSISPDGNYLFLYKNNTHGSYLGGDIYTSKVSKKGKWAVPISLGPPVNTSFYEDGACLSPDGNTLYFISERPGGYGRADIYKAHKISRTEWGRPENLGPVVNSSYDEGAPFMAPDGHTLFFSSDGHTSMGGYDIFKTSMNDSNQWTTPVNLGYPINTVGNEKNFTISADARTGYFSSDRKGGMGGRDIYIVDLSNYSVLAGDANSSQPKGYSILRGTVSNHKGEPMEGVRIIISDSTEAKVATLSTSSEGFYFITLKGDAKYKVKVSEKEYRSSTKLINLPNSTIGTYTLQQDFILEKQ